METKDWLFQMQVPGLPGAVLMKAVSRDEIAATVSEAREIALELAATPERVATALRSIGGASGGPAATSLPD